ncbi:hypothetical protein L2E82_11009 [Cichorium intybus]|uniref:Uncharacterized protein n=1 Tax=Cichorium intybus TaxID=13427 RepID=A0ACB9GD92_CICIN|nr:hypothetical protein L2E82_11009 [Cichorium intybus]
MKGPDDEVSSTPVSPKPPQAAHFQLPLISAPPQFESPSLPRSPLSETPQHSHAAMKTRTGHRISFSNNPPLVCAPLSHCDSPSMPRSPILCTPDRPVTAPTSGDRTPFDYIMSRNLSPNFLTRLASPLRNVKK